MKLKNRIMPILLAGALSAGAAGAAIAQDSEAAKQKILTSEITAVKSFNDNEGFKGNAFIKLADQQKFKFFLSGSYEDRDIHLNKTENLGSLTRSMEANQNFKIGKINPEVYFRSSGEDVFATLRAGYEYVNVSSADTGKTTLDSVVAPRDFSEKGHANIIYANPGIKIGSGDKWVHIGGIVQKVYSKLGEQIGPREIFAGMDNSPLSYGVKLNFRDLLLFDAIEVKPEQGPKSQIYVGVLNNNFASGEGKINNKAIVEFLNKYYDQEKQWRFTDIFQYQTPGGKLISLLASYKTDGDVRAELFVPVTKNFQIGAGYQVDEFKSYEKGKNKFFDLGAKVRF